MAGILSGPRGILARLRWLIRGKVDRRDGYPVQAVAAVEAPARSDPGAVRCWRENTPHLVKPGHFVVFPAQVCREETTS